MYIKDDICYASKVVDAIRIIQVKPLTGRMLLVLFNTGEKKLFDTTKLKGSAFSKLDKEEIFMKPKLFHGIITWDNGTIDIAPEKVYEDGMIY